MNPWERVRNHWVANMDQSLAAVRSESRVVKAGAEWSSIVCPLCTDKDGSASISVTTGYLNCRQCGKRGNLFDWLSLVSGLTPLDTMLQVAEQLGVKIERTKKKGRKGRFCDVDAQLEQAIIDLWKLEEAEPLRKEVERRGFRPEHLAPYSIGWYGGHLVFPHFDDAGRPRQRYHAWHGPLARPKWTFGGPSGVGVRHGLWPSQAPPDETKVVLLCAGEWDVLTARERWRLPDQGIWPVTWTGGETTPLRLGDLPEWCKGLDVWVAYDCDVWQGPDVSTFKAPSPKQLEDGLRRRKNLLEGVCWPLHQLGNKVGILTVPNPAAKFSADLRDFYDWCLGQKKLPTLDEWELTPYDPVAQKVKGPARECTFAEAALALPGERLKFESLVSSVFEDMGWPKTTKVECDAGAHPFCSACNLPRDYPDQLIRWEQNPEGLARFLSVRERDREKAVWSLIGKPPACHVATLRSEIEFSASKWQASDPDGGSSHELVVASKQVGSIGDLLVIEGTKLARTDSISTIVLADSIAEPERSSAHLGAMIERLHQLCPWDTTDADVIWNHLYFQRHDDLAAYVTEIFGRQNFHIAFDLVAHSSLWWLENKRKTRAWLDANITANTRSGKTQTAKRLAEHYRMPIARLSFSSRWSSAGLIASNEHDGDGYRVKAGILPRLNGTMSVFDELQTSAGSRRSGAEALMPALQELRDSGEVQIAKAAARKMKCVLRLLTMGNPVGGFERYGFPCQAIEPLYATSEAIARMDFAVIQDTTNESLGIVVPAAMREQVGEHRFTDELCHGLARRAWDVQPEDIRVDEEAIVYATEIAKEWMSAYDSSIPFFTGPEKKNSLLRIAISVANLTFSHVKPDVYMQTHVRIVHVEWAKQWLEGLWHGCLYDRYSERSKVSRITRPWLVEWYLIEYAGPDVGSAINKLEWLIASRSRQALMSWLGKSSTDFDLWISKCLQSGLLELMDAAPSICYAPTPAGARMIRRIMAFCEFRAGEWRSRYDKFNVWYAQSNISDPPKIDPLPDIEEE